MREIETAYPKKALEACGVDFVRDEAGRPKPLLGGLWTGVTLVSLDWGSKREVWITRPLTESEKIPGREVNGKWYIPTGGVLSDRFDRAVMELREPPPLWVDP